MKVLMISFTTFCLLMLFGGVNFFIVGLVLLGNNLYVCVALHSLEKKFEQEQQLGFTVKSSQPTEKNDISSEPKDNLKRLRIEVSNISERPLNDGPVLPSPPSSPLLE
jgi:hypothetical protein